jgi:hypothetical protein
MATTNSVMRSEREGVLRNVKTPLNFFVLIVLISESILLAVLASDAVENRGVVIGLMVGMPFLLVALVAFLAFYRPEALSGLRMPEQHSGVVVAQLAGEWDMLLRTSDDRTVLGKVTITQEFGRPYFKVIGEVTNFDAGKNSILFTSIIGGVVDHEVYFIYRNNDNEVGVVSGVVPSQNPTKLSLDYRDLIGLDKNNDPYGRIELSRSGENT